MGDYTEYSAPNNDFVAETPDLKPLIDAHGAMVRNGMDPATAAAVTRGLYAPALSHGHLQRWLQVAWPIEQPPAPTPQQHASGAAVAALVQRTGAPPQQAAAQMTQVFGTRPYQPPPQRASTTPISELHHYGVLRQVYGATADPSEPSDDVLNRVGDFQRSEYPNGVPSDLLGNRHQLKRAIADWSDRQDADARGAITNTEPGTRDWQLPGEYYADTAQERHDAAAKALTGSPPAETADSSDTQDADARLAIGGQ